MNKVISILIPTYNMEKYLGRCLDSLLIEEIDTIEVIVINDGSQDRSSEIAHSYEERFPNSFVVIDKENGNYGSCINAGLSRASGKYVKVLDSDDYFDSRDFSLLVKHLQSSDVDAVLTNYCRVIDGENKRYEGRNLQNSGLPNQVELDLEIIQRNIYYPLMHLVTYKLSVLKQINYTQTEGVSYTDTEWCFIPFASCKTFAILPLTVYCYMVGREGQTISPEAMLRSNPSFYKIIKKMVGDFNHIKSSLTASQQLYLSEYLDNVYNMLVQRTLKSKDAGIYSGFQTFEVSIRDEYPETYSHFGTIPYNRHTSYPYIQKWRESGYSINFDLPWSERIKNCLIANGSKFRKKIGLKALYSKKH